jgi:TrmH family RNA methyltransferase
LGKISEIAVREATRRGKISVNELMENLRVVLVATRNPLNMGASARAMSNFGALHLRVVKPYEKAYRESVSAVGASAVMKSAEEFATVPEAVADCSLVVGTTAVGNRDVRQPLLGLQEAARLIRQRMENSRVALLFGSEKRGLSNDDMSYCHWLLRIPTREEHRSMNLGQAAAVCLYELAKNETGNSKLKNSASGGAGEKHFATMETVERITEAWLEALQRSGYVGARASSTSEEKLRRMLLRLNWDESDAEVVLGMMKKIAAKLNNE